jgi:dipeptidase E
MRRILCIGGHDFGTRPGDRGMTDLIASLARERAGGDEPRICLLPTASGDAAEQSSRFFAAFGARGAIASELSLFRLTSRPVVLRDHLLSQDLIYVGGGSLVNLLAVWEAHDVGSLLRLAWENGTVIVGQSAGAMCWFETGVTKGSGSPQVATGLGVLPGSLCVHYRNEPERRQLMLEAVEGGIPNGYGIDDYAALLFNERELAGIYSARNGANAYRVSWERSKVVESKLAATVLEPSQNGGSEAMAIAEFRRLRRATTRLGMRGR